MIIDFNIFHDNNKKIISIIQDDIAASTVPSTTTTFSITYLANISATTEAGSYTTTLTYTATGLY